MKNKFALWSFILGIINILLFLFMIFSQYTIAFIIGGEIYFLLLLFILSILALVFGIIGTTKAKEQDGKAFAIIGIISGTIFLVFMLYIIMPKRI